MEFIKVPLSVVKDYKRESILWILFVILAGQFGVICNWFIQTFFTQNTLISAIKSDFGNGNFYIFTISLMASSFFIVLVSFLYDQESHFKSIKLFTLVFLGIGILWCGIVHSLVQLKPTYIYADYVFKYCLQFIGYLVGIFFSIYAACIVKLNYDNETHKKVDDKSFHKKTDQSVKEMEEKSKAVTKDRKGRTL